MSKLLMLCESCQDENELNKLDRARYKANLKFDGERIMAIKKDKDILLVNRRNNIVNFKFQEVVRELKLLEGDFIVDGEIISFDDDFTKLQRRALTKDLKKIEQLEKEIPVKYVVFDILSIGEKSVMSMPLRERVILLQNLIVQGQHIEIAYYGEIDNMLSFAIENDREGIVIKDMNASYESKRSKAWLKHKLFKETTLTITGFTDNNAGIRATDDKENVVQIAGHHAVEVKQVLQSNGYANVIVQYLEKTKEGRLRFPSYKRLSE